MIVFPLKWLPWILAIGGFVTLVTTGEPFSIVTMLIGVVWLYYSFKDKKGGTSAGSTSQNSSNNNTVYKAATQATTNTNVCPNCKTSVDDGMAFCMMCGTKVK